VKYQDDSCQKITKLRLNLSKLYLEYCGLFFPDTVYLDHLHNIYM